MAKLSLQFINGKKLLKRWEMEGYELYQAVFDYELPIYDRKFHKIEDLFLYIHPRVEITEYFLSKYQGKNICLPAFSDSVWRINFLIDDVEHFEHVYEKIGRKEPGDDSAGLLKKLKLRFINYERLVTRWNMTGEEFRQVIYNYNLPIYAASYYSALKKLDNDGLRLLEITETRTFFTGEYPNYFMMEDVLRLEKKYGKLEQVEYSKKKLRPNQRHKIQCRNVAKKIWEKHPTITIANMICKDETIEACDGKLYTEKTIRNWIKDLCPDRSRGRRRGT